MITTAELVVVAAGAPGSWVSARAASEPAARMFCFPHAGGSNVAFSGWRERLPSQLDVVSFCYPGRLRRIREEPLTDLQAMVAELSAAISGMLDVPFIFFGHSLGALVALELARHLRRHGGPQPTALIASGHHAPQLPRRTPDLHHLPREQLLRELTAMEGLPPGLDQSDEFITLVLPAIRADLRMHETYVYREEPPLDCPILAVGGRSDPQVTPAEVEAWKHQTHAEFSSTTFPGGHFFLFAVRDELSAVIASSLSEWLIED